VAPLAAGEPAIAGGRLPPPPTEHPLAPIQLLSTIQLEQVEIDFLASPEIGRVASSTPRAVKRLVNIYRIVRARLSESGREITGVAPKDMLYPLIALAAAVETGRTAEVADAFCDGLMRS
jgi:hypothetical protein